MFKNLPGWRHKKSASDGSEALPDEEPATMRSRQQKLIAI
jgi:hypothetical protein